MASPVIPGLDPAASPRQPAALTDDLLEEIFLRIRSAADLARASFACASFRRLIADPSFLRRYRTLHPPLLLGFLSCGFDPAEAPHPNAPAARAIASAAGFSFDYLPPGRWGRWDPCDVRDGRVLVKSSLPDYDLYAFPDLAVCDPLSERYLLLPPILCEELIIESFDAFLVPSGDWEGTSFEVVGMMNSTKMMVFHFSSISGYWSVCASTSLNALVVDETPPMISRPQYTNGCFYWKVHQMTKLLKLDMNRMEFSTMDLPPYHGTRNIAVVDAGEGRLGMFSRVRHGTCVDYYTISQSESESGNNWQMKDIIPLPASYNFRIAGAAEGYLFLVGTPMVKDMVTAAAYFSLDIKTLEIEMVGRIRIPFFHLCPYFGFPPSMTPRRI